MIRRGRSPRSDASDSSAQALADYIQQFVIRVPAGSEITELELREPAPAPALSNSYTHVTSANKVFLADLVVSSPAAPVTGFDADYYAFWYERRQHWLERLFTPAPPRLILVHKRFVQDNHSK